MAIQLKQIKDHVGHEIECVEYGGGVNHTIECVTCGMVLIDDHADAEEECCIRCGSPLENEKCTDISCPFSEYDQTDQRGWAGHPEKK